MAFLKLFPLPRSENDPKVESGTGVFCTEFLVFIFLLRFFLEAIGFDSFSDIGMKRTGTKTPFQKSEKSVTIFVAYLTREFVEYNLSTIPESWEEPTFLPGFEK